MFMSFKCGNIRFKKVNSNKDSVYCKDSKFFSWIELFLVTTDLHLEK